MHASSLRYACTRQAAHIASSTTRLHHVTRLMPRPSPPRAVPLPWPPAADVVLAPARCSSASSASASSKPDSASTSSSMSSGSNISSSSPNPTTTTPSTSGSGSGSGGTAPPVTRAALKLIHELHRAPPALERLRVRGDGACMFRSLAQGDALLETGALLSEPAEWAGAAALRARVVDRLRATRGDIEPFIPGIVEGAETFEGYLERMARPATWGELAAASQVLQRPVAVYSPAMVGPPQHIITYGSELPSPPVHVLWSGAHYDLLVPRGVRSRL